MQMNSPQAFVMSSDLTLNRGTCPWICTVLPSSLLAWFSLLPRVLPAWPAEWQVVPLSSRTCEYNKSLSL